MMSGTSATSSSSSSFFRRFLAAAFLFAITIVAIVWIVLESGALSDQRRGLVSDILTDQIGQNVRFTGDIRVRLGLSTKVWIEDVAVQSRGMSKVDVLQIDEVRFELDTWELIQQRIDWDNFILSGANFLFVKETDGRTSWKSSEPTPENDAGGGKTKAGLLELLRDRNVEIADSSLTLDFQDSGFFFSFNLEDFAIAQEMEGRLTLVDGNGKLNGQDVSVEGAFPAESEFSANLQVGGTASKISGTPLAGSDGREFDARLTTEFTSIGDFQQAIGLERTSEGQGSLQADLKGFAGGIAIQALEISVENEDGRHLRIEGDIDNLFHLQGTDLAVSVTFQNPVTLFQPGQRAFEVSLEQISAEISGDPESFELKNIAVKTNAINPSFKKIGPMEIGKLFRTEEGEISLSGIRLAVGNAENPYLTVDGEIGDALELKQIALKAHLDIEATELFPFISFEDEKALGRVIGDLMLSDKTGALSLDNLTLHTAETDLWDTTVNVVISDLEKLGDVKTDIGLALKKPAVLLGLLGLKTSMADPISFTWSTQKAGEEQVDMNATLKFARTDVEAKMTAGFRGYKPTLDGDFSGQSVHILDIRRLLDLGKTLAGFVVDPYSNRTAKPLVITREAKPLVVAREAKPLVLGNPKDVLRIDRLLNDAEVHIGIDIGKIFGVSALNKVNAVLKIDEGIARLEPITISVVGGTAKAAISSNLIDKPSRLTANGQLRAVGLETLMKLANSDLDAQGSISGPFNLSFDIKQMSNLLGSTSGTTRLSLTDGRIATSLLNLAGLGVIPWLFSKELQRGYTEITCAIVPIVLSRGIVSLDNTVIETPSVQVLVNGQINLLNETLFIRAIPRPLNQANARSPFPVTISGPLSSPKVSIERDDDSGENTVGIPHHEAAGLPGCR